MKWFDLYKYKYEKEEKKKTGGSRGWKSRRQKQQQFEMNDLSKNYKIKYAAFEYIWISSVNGPKAISLFIVLFFVLLDDLRCDSLVIHIARLFPFNPQGD